MSIQYRQFESYSQYVAKQGAKAVYSRDKILKGIPRRIKGFENVFRKNKKHMISGKVLCVGARTGCEVKGAINAGFVGSIGVDLFPMTKDVMQADWSKLPLPDNSFENVFTNSFDHCLDLKEAVLEAKRVLVPGGVFFLMIPERTGPRSIAKMWQAAGGNEAMFWEHTDDILPDFKAAGFELSKFQKSQGKWSSYFLRSSCPEIAQ